jgi:hypothetical protein
LRYQRTDGTGVSKPAVITAAALSDPDAQPLTGAELVQFNGVSDIPSGTCGD